MEVNCITPYSRIISFKCDAIKLWIISLPKCAKAKTGSIFPPYGFWLKAVLPCKRCYKGWRFWWRQPRYCQCDWKTIINCYWRLITLMIIMKHSAHIVLFNLVWHFLILITFEKTFVAALINFNHQRCQQEPSMEANHNALGHFTIIYIIIQSLFEMKKYWLSVNNRCASLIYTLWL